VVESCIQFPGKETEEEITVCRCAVSDTISRPVDQFYVF